MTKTVTGALAGLALGAFSAVSAIDFSVGGGGIFASDFGGGLTGVKLEISVPLYLNGDISMVTPWFGGGGFVFFDATYAEASVSFIYGSGSLRMETNLSGLMAQEVINQMNQMGIGNNEKMADGSMTALNIGVLGKYPLRLGSISVYPAAGIEYAICLSAELDGEKMNGENGMPKAVDFSTLWFKFGGGLDYDLGGSMFVRAQFLYGFRAKNKADNDLADLLQFLFEWGTGGNVPGVSMGDVTGHGMTIKAGIGFKL